MHWCRNVHPLVELGCGRSGQCLNFFFFFTMDESTLISCGEQDTVQSNSYTHFFVIKCTNCTSNSSFKNTSPFLIEIFFKSILGDVCSDKKLQSGHLLVEISAANQSQLFSNCKK